MFAGQRVRRRIQDALAVASPLALAEAMDAHIAGRSGEDVRALIASSIKRMDAGDKRQLDLYLDLDRHDDLLGHRFSAFLRQNPRALAALDPDVLNAILADLGELPMIEHASRRIPLRTAGLLGLALAVAILPLAAQYIHQRGLLQGLNAPPAPPPIVPFVQQVAAHPALPAHRLHYAHKIHRHAPPKRVIAYAPHPRPRPHMRPHQHRRIARVRHGVWRHPYVADASRLGARARLDVSGYLRAIIDGDLPAAFKHL
jgi:hypothetical protein